MPSAFAHALVGATLSRLAPPPFRGARLAVTLAIAAALPDVDVVAFRAGIAYGDPLGHRGFTHSLLFAFLFAAAIWLVFSRGLARNSAAGAGLFAVVFAACASHGVLDAFTDAGLGVGFFVPFDDTRYFFPWRPILTSPLGLRQFFSESGAAILLNEAAWVGLPCALLLVIALLTQSSSRLPNNRWLPSLPA